MKKTINMNQLKIIGFLLSLFLICTSCYQEDKEVITIATSANMQFAIEEITKAFTKKTGLSCTLVIGSSGKLTAQIKEGAPYDIFVAANMKYPNEIHKSGLAADIPKIYALGQLVLWSVDTEVPTSIRQLTHRNIHHIALANPKTAPYGEAAVQVLQQARMYDSVIDKLVYGESIAQTNQFIISKSAEIGFTAKSVVMSPRMKGKGVWVELDKNTYSPIDQGVVAIKSTEEHMKRSEKFYDFLFSSEAREILEDFGYLVTE
ncbi:molybdate ABC transporter substrate-binding protein [Aquimarina addita]|uniref:Molybdate ABC transporter substrate-binding protein n=1 Tax=Aquimarina addita TaxID=870485 RepID=A0ABP6UTK4_9FLAO